MKKQKVRFVIYVDKWYLFKKIDTWKNNPAKLFTIDANKNTADEYLIFTKFANYDFEDKHDFYRSYDCMEKNQ